MENPSIDYVEQGLLKLNARNASTHSAKQITQIAVSIAEFEYTAPILIDTDNKVIARHGQLKAAAKLGMTRVPTVRFDHLTPEQLRAYAIAGNQLALNAGWDPEMLRLELGELQALDLDFDLTLTGFDWPEINSLINPVADSGEHDPLDEAPEPEDAAVTRPGDL